MFVKQWPIVKTKLSYVLIMNVYAMDTCNSSCNHVVNDNFVSSLNIERVFRADNLTSFCNETTCFVAFAGVEV